MIYIFALIWLICGIILFIQAEIQLHSKNRNPQNERLNGLANHHIIFRFFGSIIAAPAIFWWISAWWLDFRLWKLKRDAKQLYYKGGKGALFGLTQLQREAYFEYIVTFADTDKPFFEEKIGKFEFYERDQFIDWARKSGGKSRTIEITNDLFAKITNDLREKHNIRIKK